MQRTIPFLAALITLSCGDPTPPDGVPQEPFDSRDLRREYSAALPMKARVNFDDRLGALGELIPGFGGLWVRSGHVQIGLQAPDRPEVTQAAAAAAAVFLTDLGYPEQLRSELLENVGFHRVQYTFKELLGWRDNLADLIAEEGVIGVDVREDANVLEFLVTQDAAGLEVARRAQEIGVPMDALLVTASDPFQQADIEGTYGALAGGIQIRSHSGETCTFTGVAMHEKDDGSWDSQRYGLTVSHCTDNFGVTTGETFYQPAPGRIIGTEAWDKPLFTSNDDSSCPQNRDCRYSDVAVIALEDSLVLTFFAHGFQDNGSEYTHWRNFGWEFDPLAGMAMAKAGRTTGVTHGEVNSTCVALEVDDTTLTLLCQFTSSAAGALGDSGAPIFQNTGSGDSYFFGIMWGTSPFMIAFSPTSAVVTEGRPDWWSEGTLCVSINGCGGIQW